MRMHSGLAATLIATLLVLAQPLRGWAQTALAASEVTAFLGAWTIGIETPQGAMSLELTIKDDAGKAAATISAPPMMPDAQAITDISKEDQSLVLKYTLEAQGRQIPAKILLTPDGDKWKASFDVADGQFTMDATATKK